MSPALIAVVAFSIAGMCGGTLLGLWLGRRMERREARQIPRSANASNVPEITALLNRPTGERRMHLEMAGLTEQELSRLVVMPHGIRKGGQAS